MPWPAQEVRRVLAHDLKRVAQTPRAFANWPIVLADMARQRLGRGPETLTFATRSGLRIVCPNRRGARVPVYEIFAEDCYRLEWFLRPLAHRPIQVIDIGGHVGTFACQLAHVHRQARIESFEPSPTTANFLRRNVSANGFGDRVAVFEQALAAESGAALLSDNGAASGTNELVRDGRRLGSGATSVRTVSLDEVVRAAPNPIDLVKIDCEGGEYDLVLGSSPESWASVQLVVLEYHPSPEHGWEQLRAWFGHTGLTVDACAPISREQGTAWLSRERVR